MIERLTKNGHDESLQVPGIVSASTCSEIPAFTQTGYSTAYRGGIDQSIHSLMPTVSKGTCNGSKSVKAEALCYAPYEALMSAIIFRTIASVTS